MTPEDSFNESMVSQRFLQRMRQLQEYEVAARREFELALQQPAREEIERTAKMHDYIRSEEEKIRNALMHVARPYDELGKQYEVYQAESMEVHNSLRSQAVKQLELYDSIFSPAVKQQEVHKVLLDEARKQGLLSTQLHAHLASRFVIDGSMLANIVDLTMAVRSETVPIGWYRVLHALLPTRDRDSIERQLEEQLQQDANNPLVGPRLASWYYRWRTITNLMSYAWNGLLGLASPVAEIVRKLRAR